MKIVYCDVCGEKCDDIGEDGVIRIEYPVENDDIATLVLRDVCWDCRLKIVNAIKDIMKNRNQP